MVALGAGTACGQDGLTPRAKALLVFGWKVLRWLGGCPHEAPLRTFDVPHPPSPVPYP